MLIYLPFYYSELSLSGVIIKLINGYYHLWYLPGLLGGMIILFFLKKTGIKNSSIFRLSIILFLIGWLIQKVRLIEPDIPAIEILSKISVSRNFIFLGFPFISIGYLIKAEKITLQKIIKPQHSWGWVILAISLLLLESHIGKIIKPIGTDFYLALFFLCPLLFLMFKDYPAKTMKSDFYAKLYVAIYFLHPLMIFLSKKIFPEFNNSIHYLMVLILSFAGSIVLIYLNRKIKIFL